MTSGTASQRTPVVALVQTAETLGSLTLAGETGLPSGIYVCGIRMGDFSAARKMAVVE